MISIIKPTDLKKLIKSIAKKIAVLAFWILVWELASRLISRNNDLLLLILPSPFTVFKTWTEIAFTHEFFMAVLSTFANVIFGFVLGIVLGFLLGVFTHYIKILDALISPMMRIVRAVPVVAFIILMYLFFESNILPIVIVCLMVMPLMWQTVHDALGHTNTELCEMAHVYKLSKPKIFLNIKLPSAMPQILTNTVNSLGLAWKSGVAAEVICLPNVSLGTILWQSKGTVDFDEVYAVTLTVVILSILLEILIKYLSKKVVERTQYA